MREAFVDQEVKGEQLQKLLRKKYELIQKHLQALVGERELLNCFIKLNNLSKVICLCDLISKSLNGSLILVFM